MERRLFERKALNLNAMLKVSEDVQVPCLIQDYCSGGLLAALSGGAEAVAKTISQVTIGSAVTVLVSAEQNRIEIEAVIARIVDGALGLKLQRSNERFMKFFQQVHLEYRTEKALKDRAQGFKSIETSIVSEAENAVPQAEPRERDRNLVAMQEFTQQFLVERLSAFFKYLREARNDATLWVSVKRSVHVRDVIETLLNYEASITDQMLKQVLPFFTVQGLREALEAVDSKTEVELSTQMALVEKDDFEEWLYIKVLARRLESESSDALAALAARIRYLIGIVVTPENNGITPENWLAYLLNCLQNFEIDFDVLQVILDFYQKTVLSQLKSYYATLNTCLDDNGILPGPSLQVFIQDTARHDLKRRKDHTNNAEIEEGVADAASEDGRLASSHSQRSSASSDYRESGSGGSGSGTAEAFKGGKNGQGQGQGQGGADSKRDSLESDQTSLLKDAGNKASFSLAKAQHLAKRAYSVAQNLIKMNLAVTRVSGATSLLSGAHGAGQGGVSIVDAVLSEDYGHSELDDPHALGLVEVVQALDVYQKDTIPYDTVDLSSFDEELLAFMKERYGTDKHWDSAQANALALAKKLFILLDKNKQLGDKARRFLSKLMIPTFKALLLDSEILLVEDTPVRSVLNLLAVTGLKGAIMNRAQEEEIHKGINTILNEFSRDVSVFNPLVDQLTELQKQQNWFFERNVERLRETCEGQYRISVNRRKVDSAIFDRLSGRTVPKVVRQFVDYGWRDLMYFSLMKEGEESKAWGASLVLLEDLIRFLSSKNIRMDALRLAPDKMMMLIERGLLKVTTPQNAHQQNELIPQLKLLLSRQAHLTPEDFEAWEGTRIRPQLNTHSTDGLRINVSAVIETDEGVKPHLEKWLSRANTFSLGSWLDFRLEGGGRMSGRLLWRAEDDSRLVFVNRQGMKLADISLQELAEGLHCGDILIVSTDSEPTIERGLDSLVQEVYSELAHEVMRDELTQLLSRREIELRLKRNLEEVHAGKPEFFVVYVRMDQLSSINASCGYEAGDEVLKQLVDRLFETAKSDENVGRSSGTDFVVMLKNVSPTAVRREADRLLSSIMAYRFEWEKMQFSVGASVGVVEVDEQYQSVDSILMDAQSACLTAQENGGNRVQIYSRGEKSIQRQQNRIVWASKVDQVLESNSVRLKVQKIAPTQYAQNANKEQLLPHYEVLIGSVGEKIGSVVDFISAAERYRRMSQVDRWVVQKVCDWMCEHRDFVDKIGGLSINISGNSMNDGDFMDHLFEVFSTTHVPCRKVCFEITETVALASLNDTVDFMMEMKNLGCLFAMDDFGAGVSSFSYLKHLPVDYLKIDGSFVKDMKGSRHDMAMVKSITDMGHLLGKKVVAEFVVDGETLDLLETMGVDYCQGFHVEMPIWFDEWTESDLSPILTRSV